MTTADNNRPRKSDVSMRDETSNNLIGDAFVYPSLCHVAGRTRMKPLELGFLNSTPTVRSQSRRMGVPQARLPGTTSNFSAKKPKTMRLGDVAAHGWDHRHDYVHIYDYSDPPAGAPVANAPGLGPSGNELSSTFIKKRHGERRHSFNKDIFGHFEEQKAAEQDGPHHAP
jgi:hypothetical protein